MKRSQQLRCIAAGLMLAFAPDAIADEGSPWEGVYPSDWIEAQLALIRRDNPPWPTVQARTLFHVSAAMHDAAAAFDGQRPGLLVTVDTALPWDELLQKIAAGHAAIEVLRRRYACTNRDGIANRWVVFGSVLPLWDVGERTTRCGRRRSTGPVPHPADAIR